MSGNRHWNSKNSNADSSDNWRRKRDPPAVLAPNATHLNSDEIATTPRWAPSSSNNWDNSWDHSTSNYLSKRDRERSRAQNSMKACSMDDLAPPRSALLKKHHPPKPRALVNNLVEGTNFGSIDMSVPKPTDPIPFDSSETPRRANWTQYAKEHTTSMEPSKFENNVNDNIAPPQDFSLSNSSADNWRRHATAVASRSISPPRYIHPDDRNNAKRKEHFKPYMNPTDIEKGLKDGSLHQGIMRFSRNRTDAYVTSDDLDFDIYIGGTSDRNRALHGDLVAVQLLDVDIVWELRKERELKKLEMKKKYDHHEEDENEMKTGSHIDNQPVEKDEDEDDDEENKKPVYCGRVVGILLRPPHTTYSGTISLQRHNNTDNNISTDDLSNTPRGPPRLAWFKPSDKRIPFIALRNQDVPADIIDNEEYYKVHLFVAEIKRWQIHDLNPTGRIIREIGPLGDLETEKKAILADNSINQNEFSPVALQSLPETPWSIPSVEYKQRRDLRSERIFSIDPKTAKDLDDALHIKELPDGFYEVGVHIADVTYFLKRNTPLDTEARDRGTSTYLVDTVIPMLPPLLCEELCSLNPGVERLAFSVIWKMDKFGKPIDTWFGKTIIESCAKLAYEDAQLVIDGENLPSNIVVHGNHDLDGLHIDIITLYKLSVEMRKQRYIGGSLSMHSVKLGFELDDQGQPISVTTFEAKAANRLVEEFMLRANISVAEKISKAFKDESLLRRHQDPLEKRLNEFIRITEVLGLNFDGYSAAALQESFDNIKNKAVKDVLLVLAIRSMQRAKYFCSGTVDISKYHHYALNEPVYTHFTSPIRRYADVIVHRLLDAAINMKDKKSLPPYNSKMVQKISFECNSKKLYAKYAQEANIELYLSKYLAMVEQRDGPVYKKADVFVVGKDTYDVYVPEYGIEKRIYLKDLPIEHHYFDKHTLALDIFWKRGVPVTMHNEEKMYAQERIRKDDYSDASEDELDQITDSLTALATKEVEVLEETVNADDLVPPVVLEENTCMQRIQMFSVIDVRIQVNMERSPPIINVYPVNPFSGEKSESSLE